MPGRARVPTAGRLQTGSMTRTLVVGALAATVASLAACSTRDGASSPQTMGTGVSFVLGGVTRIEQVAQLTGPASINHTDAVEVAGQDLGSMFDADGRTWFLFGDTFGKRTPDQTGGGGTEWRSNTLAYTSDANPADGIRFDGYITDEKGWAKELVPAKQVDGDEMTIIPTYGFAANGAMYLDVMSVRHWGEPGEWETNYSGLAKSTDRGHTWTPLASPRWPGTSNFVQVSVTNVNGDLYFWGVTHGRFGGVQLMKVTEKDVEKQTAYQYFTGIRGSQPQWSSDINAAKTIVDGTVGELSVAWNDYLQRWLMSSTDGGDEGTTIREGITPWGPWNAPKTLLTQTDLPGLYAPYLHPRYVENGGRTIYFTVSQWGPYNVFWYKADLVKAT